MRSATTKSDRLTKAGEPGHRTDDPRERLLCARQLAESGRQGEARAVCAVVLRTFQWQLANDPMLFQMTVETLRRARAYEQLRRFCTAAGRDMPFEPAPPARSAAFPNEGSVLAARDRALGQARELVEISAAY